MGKLPHRIYRGLKTLQGGLKTLDEFGEELTNGFGAYKTMQRVLDETANKSYNVSEAEIDSHIRERARREAIHIFFDLRRQGFATEKADGMIITKRGREKLMQLAVRFKKVLPHKVYEVKKATDLIIVSFDIPEKERQKRDWLRSVLKHLGLRLYHRSLWMGNIIVPEEFIHDLTQHHIDRYVAIFTVGKRGTLRKLI